MIYLKILLGIALFAAGWFVHGWEIDASTLKTVQLQHTQAVQQQKKDVSADLKTSQAIQTVQTSLPKIITRIQRVNVKIPPTPDSCKPFDPLTPDWLREYDATDTPKANGGDGAVSGPTSSSPLGSLPPGASESPGGPFH